MAASAAAAIAPAPTPVLELPLPGPELVPEWLAITPPDKPASAASAASAAAAADAFEWPPSTRLSYRLSGNYRGPVEGQASVEWLRSGTRYQVLMDLSIGPSFAPLMSRRVSSDGEVTAEGLQPQRYDEETRLVWTAPRRLNIQMDADTVRLADGSLRPRPPGLQDSASQFVQLTWLFTTQPELLQPGRSITLPLALPRQVEPWIYDVLDSETLDTPAGPVAAVHVKPRRVARPGVDLTAEVWVAPSLQYLPVRILIRQSADTYIDLNIERLPEQAAPYISSEHPRRHPP
jgi:cell division septation protein DedD